MNNNGSTELVILIFMGVFMTQIEKSNSNMEITVNSANGEACISQRKAAELLGVSQSSIRDFCHLRNLDVKEGLSSEIFSLATQYNGI